MPRKVYPESLKEEICKRIMSTGSDHLLPVTDTLDVTHAKLHAIVEVVQLVVGAIEPRD